MLEINRNNSEIIIKEVFSFGSEVLPYVYKMKESLEFEIDEVSEYIIDNVKEFIDYEITKDDEFEILKLIKESYEQDICFNFETSLFDEKRIEKCLNDWVADKFNFNYEETVFCC